MITAKAAAILGAVVLLPLGAWAAMAGIKHEIEQKYELRVKGDSLKTAQKDNERVLHERDSVAREKQQVRIAYVDKLLPPGRTKPVPVDSARGINDRCTEEAKSCAARAKAAEDLVKTLQARVDNAEKVGGVQKPSRLGVSADLFGDVFNRPSAGARLTTTARVAGPISLFAEGQATVRSAREIATTPRDSSRVRTQLLVGARITFR